MLKRQISRSWLPIVLCSLIPPFVIPIPVLAYGNWTDPMLVGIMNEDQERCTRIAVDNDGIPWVVWMAIGGGDWDIFFSRYIDGAWEERQLVHPENSSYDGYPRVAAGEDGKLWVLWRVSCGDDYCLVCSHWTGQVFSVPDTVFRYGEYYDQYDIAARDTGLVWVAASMRDDGAGDRNLWFRTRTDGVWGDVELFDRPGDDWSLSITLDDSDQPLVAWENDDRIWFMEMGDSTWTEPVEVIERYSSGPYVRVDCYGRVWVTAIRSPSVNLDVWYTYREQGNWAEPDTVNEPDTRYDVDRMSMLVIQHDGIPRVFWDAYISTAPEYWSVMTSVWQGAGWSPEEMVSIPDSILMRQDCEAYGASSPDGTIWVTWRRIDPPYWVEHVYAAQSLFVTSAQPPDSDASTRVDEPGDLSVADGILSVVPNPAAPGVRIRYALRSSGNAWVRIFDSSGRVVREMDIGQVRVDSPTPVADSIYWDSKTNGGNRAASGVYFVRLFVDHKPYGSSRKVVISR